MLKEAGEWETGLISRVQFADFLVKVGMTPNDINPL